MKLKNHYSLRFLMLVMLFISTLNTALAGTNNETTTEGGINYRVFITGSGNEAVADSAFVVSVSNQDFNGVANIASSVTCEYKWKELIGYDEYNKPIYEDRTRYLSCPVVRIYESAFNGCANLTSVSIPNSVTSIGKMAFFHCTRLTSIVIPNSVTSIGYSAFHGCTNLKNVNIPSSITTIEKYTFYGCENLDQIVIPNSVTTIEALAFEGARINSLTVPSSVTTIDDRGLACYLKELNWNVKHFKGTFWNTEEFEDNLDRIGLNPDTFVTLEKVTIGNEVEVILPYFASNSIISEVTIPNSVTSIGSQAFQECKSLTKVTIGNAVASIGEAVFAGCTNLTSINIPNSITSIPYGFLYECSSLSNVDIPNTVVTIGDYAFNYCTKLSRVIIPNSVTSIGYAFVECDSLTSLTIGKSVTEIGYGAFSPNLDYYDYPYHHLKSLTWNAKHCETMGDIYGFEILTIGNEVEFLPDRFAYESFITEVNIPNSVTWIGEEAFGGCSGLTSIDIPNTVTHIGDYAFNDCTGVTSVNIGNSVVFIGNSAFSGCKITSVNIPNTVTTIGRDAFSYCRRITNVIIGNSVISIGAQAFYRDSINDVTCYAVVPPTITQSESSTYNYYCFDGYTYNNAVLRVPAGSLQAYREAEDWKAFKYIVEIAGDSNIGDVDGDGNINTADLSNLIDLLLMGNISTTDYPGADVDQDGHINMADVSALIDILLDS